MPNTNSCLRRMVARPLLAQVRRSRMTTADQAELLVALLQRPNSGEDHAGAFIPPREITRLRMTSPQV